VLILLSACGVSRDADLAATAGDDEVETSVDATGTSEVGTDGEGATTEGSVEQTPVIEAAPDEVAMSVVFEDGTSSELSFGDYNDIVVPTQGNAEFVQLVYGGTPPADFGATVLFQSILGEVITNELALIDAEPSPEDLVEAKSRLLADLRSLMIGTQEPEAEFERLYGEVPYLPFFADLHARQIALSTNLAATAGPDERSPCARHILVDTEPEAIDVLAELEDGADFAALAAERSVGPTGPAGGDLGCVPPSRYVPEFAAAITDAPVDEYLGPIQTQFGWHVIVVYGYEVDGDELARIRIGEGLAAATVTIDDRLGQWDPTIQAVVPADVAAATSGE
jgi:hypothetical protein